MQAKIELFLLLTLTLIVSVNLIDLGGECNDKAIINGNSFLYDTYEEHKSAFHGAASCVSLHTEEDDSLCCHLKVRYRNRAAGKKYTHKGCIEMLGSNLGNLSHYIDDFENRIAQDENIDKVDVDIDCNSKFIRITGLILLAFLL